MLKSNLKFMHFILIVMKYKICYMLDLLYWISRNTSGFIDTHTQLATLVNGCC